DIQSTAVAEWAREIATQYGVDCRGMAVDITSPEAVKSGFDQMLSRFNRADILINNAANDPKVTTTADLAWSRLENFSLDRLPARYGGGLNGGFSVQPDGGFLHGQVGRWSHLECRL
ncbi:MAG: SDR family oxidoreductase, partial [Desulfobaccales bacterium]